MAVAAAAVAVVVAPAPAAGTPTLTLMDSFREGGRESKIKQKMRQNTFKKKHNADEKRREREKKIIQIRKIKKGERLQKARMPPLKYEKDKKK